MATIIKFPAAMSARLEKSERPQGPAKILFFTGVRYERFQKAQKRKPKAGPVLPLAL